MNLLLAVDIGSVIILFLGIFTLIISGLIEKYLSFSGTHALQAAVIIIFFASMITAGQIFSIEKMRFIIAVILSVFIIPISITFILIWSLSVNSSYSRVQIVSYVSWLLSLLTTLVLRVIFGWGFSSGIIGVAVLLITTSILDGLLGALIGRYLISRSEKYLPSQE